MLVRSGSCAFALNDLGNNCSGVELYKTKLRLVSIAEKLTGYGNGVAYCQAFNAFTLYTVANDGLVSLVAYYDGNGDILVLLAIRSINRCDLTGQGVVTKSCALFKCPCCVNNLSLRSHSCPNDVVALINDNRYFNTYRVVPQSALCLGLILSNRPAVKIGQIACIVQVVGLAADCCLAACDINRLKLCLDNFGLGYIVCTNLIIFVYEENVIRYDTSCDCAGRNCGLGVPAAASAVAVVITEDTEGNRCAVTVSGCLNGMRTIYNDQIKLAVAIPVITIYAAFIVEVVDFIIEESNGGDVTLVISKHYLKVNVLGAVRCEN